MPGVVDVAVPGFVLDVLVVVVVVDVSDVSSPCCRDSRPCVVCRVFGADSWSCVGDCVSADVAGSPVWLWLTFAEVVSGSSVAALSAPVVNRLAVAAL
jgi:hypothetical protein